MDLRKDFEILIEDLRKNSDELLRGDNINYSRIDTLFTIDGYKNYKGVSFTLIGDNVYYDASTLPYRGMIKVRKTNIKTGTAEYESYPMPDDIYDIIYDYGKYLLGDLK